MLENNPCVAHVSSCVPEIWSRLPWLWWFGFRLEQISGNCQIVVHVKSGQKLHNNNHLTTFTKGSVLIPDALCIKLCYTNKQIERKLNH